MAKYKPSFPLNCINTSPRPVAGHIRVRVRHPSPSAVGPSLVGVSVPSSRFPGVNVICPTVQVSHSGK